MNRLYLIISVAFALFIAAVVHQPEKLSWYMVPYMGVVKHYTEHDMSKVHTEVFQELERITDKDEFYYLTDYKPCVRCCIAYATPSGIEGQFKVCRQRSVSTLLSVVFYKLGVPLSLAVQLPSVLAIAIIVFVMFLWLRMYLSNGLALTFAILLALLPDFYAIRQMPGPGAMSNMFILAFLYLLAVGKNKWWWLSILVLAICTRVDNIALVLAFGGVSFLGNKKALIWFGGIAIVFIGAVYALATMPDPSIGLIAKLQQYVGAYPLLYKDAVVRIWWPQMLSIYELQQTYMYYVIAIVAALILGNAQTKKLSCVVVIAAATHLLLFPHLEYRFFAAYNAAAIILLIKSLSELHKKSRQLSA